MQGRLQETLDNWQTAERLDGMRQAFERRLASLDTNLGVGAVARTGAAQANPELEVRAKKETKIDESNIRSNKELTLVIQVCEHFSENVTIVANEPTLAMYRIQEHVRKTMPQMLDKKHHVQNLQRNIQGTTFDIEYAIQAVKDMPKARPHFTSIQELLKNALFMKQQIQYENERRNLIEEGSRVRSSSLSSHEQPDVNR